MGDGLIGTALNLGGFQMNAATNSDLSFLAGFSVIVVLLIIAISIFSVYMWISVWYNVRCIKIHLDKQYGVNKKNNLRDAYGR
jgi:hypothetical protein